MNKTILIIDDDDMLRKTLARGLRDNSFNVLTANSAESGTEILSRVTVDAIILDRMLGGIDGLTMLKELRAAGVATPVIMLTAMGGAENAIDGLAGGANDYLAKPFQLRELILRLNNIIHNKAATSEIKMPNGLIFTDEEFFITNPNEPGAAPRILPLSGEEKKSLEISDSKTAYIIVQFSLALLCNFLQLYCAVFLNYAVHLSLLILLN